jgi:hypothetical protein
VDALRRNPALLDAILNSQNPLDSCTVLALKATR